ncbi:hypothetical protein FGO68_gene2422 [Halteria grandinella]|uniref:Uncharacterized protein n=1 Tax=Halteria grandinella TaxID=5974 RepID=A0A8J8SUX6_HALGN|nr:hypothetical protein FGO68_gene2422 [Halteria grandinella]
MDQCIIYRKTQIGKKFGPKLSKSSNACMVNQQSITDCSVPFIFKLGKLKSKYHIFEILSYSFNFSTLGGFMNNMCFGARELLTQNEKWIKSKCYGPLKQRRSLSNQRAYKGCQAYNSVIQSLTRNGQLIV